MFPVKNKTNTKDKTMWLCFAFVDEQPVCKTSVFVIFLSKTF